MADSLTEEELARLEALHAAAIAERDGPELTMVAASRFFQELAHHAPDLLTSARAVRNVEALIAAYRAFPLVTLSCGTFARRLEEALSATNEPTAGEER